MRTSGCSPPAMKTSSAASGTVAERAGERLRDREAEIEHLRAAVAIRYRAARARRRACTPP